MTGKVFGKLTKWSIWAIVWCAIYRSVEGGGPQSLRCSRRHYRHRAVQIDMNGLQCWGDVKILSCSGRCLSHEIGDFEFPYKKSHHPVCVHGERRHASATLSNCDEGVTPGTEVYHYVEAKNCKCQLCSSVDTSCEWLPPDANPFDMFNNQYADTESD